MILKANNYAITAEFRKKHKMTSDSRTFSFVTYFFSCYYFI